MTERLWLGQPLYRNLSVTFLKSWKALDTRDVVGMTDVQSPYLGASMQHMMDTALLMNETTPWDRIVVLEQDMILPADALHRIAREHEGTDVVCAVYFGHAPPHVVQACYLEPDGSQYTPYGPETVKGWLDNPGLHPVDSVAMGCTSISRRCLEEWDQDILAWYGDVTVPSGLSHDVHFSHQARRQGFSVAIDSGILPGHLTEIQVTWEHNQEAW